MKAAMVGYLGTAPAVMTELARYLLNDSLSDVVMLPTRADLVVAGARLVETALRANYPKLHVHIHFLPLKDVKSEEDNIIAARELARVICKERHDYGIRKIYLNVAGGRKETVIMATILGTYLGASGAYHVVHEDVRGVNIYQEQIMDLVSKFYDEDIDRRIEIYMKNRDKLDPLLFPDPRKLEFIRIPIIPPRPEELAFIKRLLRPGGIDLEEERVPEYVLELYRAADLIGFDKFRAWPTELGEELGKMIRCEYR